MVSVVDVALNRSQTRELVGEPLHCDCLLLDVLAKELALGVVLLNEVVEDSSRLPDCEVAVLVVDKGRHSAVGIDLEELLALDTVLGVVAEVEGYDIVGQAKLLQEDGSLERVWAAGNAWKNYE